MTALPLHDVHAIWNACFTEVHGCEAVLHYGDTQAEYAALRESAAWLDLSFRGRLCLTGTDRQRFLNGQVTNNVKDLQPAQGCYAALVTAKGKMVSDLNIYCLADELLLDLEPGWTSAVGQRLEKYIIADDVQVVDVSPLYGLLSVQGPNATAALGQAGLALVPPDRALDSTRIKDTALGEVYCMNQPRAGTAGFDLYVPAAALGPVAERLLAAVRAVGGGLAGWQALETVRIEAGLPRFGADMDETNLAPETGIEERAISYSKGCYIGQEIIARLRTYGQVAKALRGLRLADDLPALPNKGDKLFFADKEVGYVTSAVASPALQTNIALGYVRREHNQVGTRLTLRAPTGDSPATIVALPFVGAVGG